MTRRGRMGSKEMPADYWAVMKKRVRRLKMASAIDWKARQLWLPGFERR